MTSVRWRVGEWVEEREREREREIGEYGNTQLEYFVYHAYSDYSDAASAPLLHWEVSASGYLSLPPSLSKRCKQIHHSSGLPKS